MTDRHSQCVYFKYDDVGDPKGYCLLHQKEIKWGFAPYCPDVVLRPHVLLSYYLVHKGLCDDWRCAYKKALGYLERMGFNDYPKSCSGNGGGKLK